MKNTNLILFYNTMFNAPLPFTEADTPEGFEMTTDRRFMRDAVAVVFHLPSLYPPLMVRLLRDVPSAYAALFRCKRLMKRRGQVWAAWFMECEVNYPHFNDPSFMKFFDLIMSHRLDSDIVVPYFHYEFHESLRRPVQEKNDGKNVCAFISSSFHKSGRLEYLKTLMNYLDVHSYGKVLRNNVLENDTGYPSKMKTYSGYKFTIAFENAVAKDYVTEKFYDPLIAGSIPVYLGAPNIDDFAPGDQCFINAADWESPKSLAQYIQAVSKDKELYASYFRWRSEPFRPAFIKLLEQQKEHAFTRLCRKIQEILGSNLYS